MEKYTDFSTIEKLWFSFSWTSQSWKKNGYDVGELQTIL